MKGKMFSDDFEEAEFNLAAGTVYRIDEKLREVNLSFQWKNYRQCFEVLQIILSEIYCFLKDKEKTEMKNTEKELEKDLEKCFENTKKGIRKFVPTLEFDHKLRKFDRRLREFMLKYKLYMKMGDSRLAAAKPG